MGPISKVDEISEVDRIGEASQMGEAGRISELNGLFEREAGKRGIHACKCREEWRFIGGIVHQKA